MLRLSMLRIYQGEAFGDILVYRQSWNSTQRRKRKS